MQFPNQRRVADAAHLSSLPLLSLLGAALCGPSLSAQDVLVTAGQIVVAPGTTLQDSALLIRDGRIAYVGDEIPAEARQAARRVDYANATISPGFVLAATTMGREQDLGENAIAFTPDLRTSEAFDPWHERLHVLPSCGVTSFGLSPSSANVVGGIGALAAPGHAHQQGGIVADELFVGFSLTQNARNPEREPTSLMGARAMLFEAFTAARNGVEVGPDLAVLREVMSGSRRAFVHADTYAEIDTVLDLGEQFGFSPVVLGAREAEKIPERMAAGVAGVVLGTIAPGAPAKQKELPAELARRNVRFAFAGRSDQMRLSAAIAVRNGLDRNTALAALTRTPAELLGVQERVGSLRQGCRADFVVFEGDLLDLHARHLATWVAGERAHDATLSHAHPATAPKTR